MALQLTSDTRQALLLLLAPPRGSKIRCRRGARRSLCSCRRRGRGRWRRRASTTATRVSRRTRLAAQRPTTTLNASADWRSSSCILSRLLAEIRTRTQAPSERAERAERALPAPDYLTMFSSCLRRASRTRQVSAPTPSRSRTPTYPHATSMSQGTQRLSGSRHSRRPVSRRLVMRSNPSTHCSRDTTSGRTARTCARPWSRSSGETDCAIALASTSSSSSLSSPRVAEQNLNARC
mmetsp:Transcript_44248/g.109558  ORF Transcript_44248/g.109558 Transcript_44248/m.109558 type:complete len:236 (+) Transcript_44248:598-1305(+)